MVYNRSVSARRTIGDVLEAARARLERLEPAEAQAAMQRGALLVDIRPVEQRTSHGEVPGAHRVDRNVLEWRLDPDSGTPDPELAQLDAQVIVLCQQGYQSSLAAAALQELGFARATDVAGGFEAWDAAGLPVVRGA
jgi:rhodanese-related sulfurtransferase